MDNKKNISMAVIKRLPKYQRYLGDLVDKGVERISSKELGENMGFTASQIRQDLNNFGDFGQQGYGYNVKDLYGEICSILGIDKNYKVVIIGAGNIGQALANYTRFNKLNFHMRGIFDVNPKLIGLRIRDIEIKDIDELEGYLKDNHIDIGIIATPLAAAQKVADILVESGIKAVLNFAPLDLNVPSDVIVQNVHLSESLLTLSCLLKQNS
ncbi:MAG: redox-sensing transcriptional repressor Rex [Bacillota bacterium]|nr:redox-sensing transcriptional repressor Rex [Bacillota bacterium]